MKYIATIILAIALLTPQAFAAQYCGETTTIKTLQFGIEQKKVRRLCGPRASVKAKEEYRFRLPADKEYSIRISVDMEKSRIPEGCRVGIKSASARPGKRWSTFIYVESNKKHKMPNYNLVFKFTVSEKGCDISLPKGFEMIREGNKCYIERNCKTLCHRPEEIGIWDIEAGECRCTTKNSANGVRG